MHTPEQAASLWCPMVRIGVTPASGGPSTINDPTSIPEFSGRCIADKCALWRWAAIDADSIIKKPFYGYCGVAGRPEVV
ncbi:hypothetical protein [Herbaspirillum huttiense]|uniref:hypothetical protein n=1 Tax=Herbaspirillum huttiense TaxID=863372 RepID=UPI003B3B4DD5